jgi:methanogenic corrinoid protein MtbC1
MNISETTPAYNLKVVVQETGIKADTLRAWERRYGLPQPGRTSAGHRIYSRRDIEIVAWLMARLEEGMTIGLAVELWESIVERGEDPLSVEALNNTSALPAATEIGSTLEDLREQWLASCLNFDKEGANTVLVHAFALFPVKLVCRDILLASMTRVGELWFEKKITVQQEHFASDLTSRRLDALIAAAPPPTRSGTVVLACPTEEQHTISLLTLHLQLRYRGWNVIYLGADVPIADFETTVTELEADLVILAAQRLFTASTLLEMARTLQETGTPVAFGGLIFNEEPTLRERIPGHFLGESVDDALPAVEQLLSFPPAPADAPPTPEQNLEAIEFFRSRQSLISADTWRMLEADQVFYPHVNETNERMAENIIAALKLGQMDYMDAEHARSRRLLDNYGIPGDWTDHYLDVYRRAASWHLGDSCPPILDWLERVRENRR